MYILEGGGMVYFQACSFGRKLTQYTVSMAMDKTLFGWVSLADGFMEFISQWKNVNCKQATRMSTAMWTVHNVLDEVEAVLPVKIASNDSICL